MNTATPTTDPLPAICERRDGYVSARGRLYGGHKYAGSPDSPYGCNKDCKTMAVFERHAVDDIGWLITEVESLRTQLAKGNP